MNCLNTLLYNLSCKDRHLLAEIAPWPLEKVCWFRRCCKENVVEKGDFSLECKKKCQLWGNPWRRTFRNVECLLGVSDSFSETSEIFSETWDIFSETWDVFLGNVGLFLRIVGLFLGIVRHGAEEKFEVRVGVYCGWKEMCYKSWILPFVLPSITRSYARIAKSFILFPVTSVRDLF